MWTLPIVMPQAKLQLSHLLDLKTCLGFQTTPAWVPAWVPAVGSATAVAAAWAAAAAMEWAEVLPLPSPPSHPPAAPGETFRQEGGRSLSLSACLHPDPVPIHGARLYTLTQLLPSWGKVRERGISRPTSWLINCVLLCLVETLRIQRKMF